VSAELVPVEVVRERAQDGICHEFVGPKVSRARCEQCGKGQTNVIHHAFPESMNTGGSGWDHFAYQNAKKQWMQVLGEMLAEAELPKPLARVLVEGELTFPRRFSKGPDQENYRYPLSKFLGDTLVEGGWIADDNWERFEFGGLAYRLERGVQRMRLIVFGSLVEQELAA
jgi:hypothetical protein